MAPRAAPKNSAGENTPPKKPNESDTVVAISFPSNSKIKNDKPKSPSKIFKIISVPRPIT